MTSLCSLLLFISVTGGMLALIQYLGGHERRVERRLREIVGREPISERLLAACRRLVNRWLQDMLGKYPTTRVNRSSIVRRLTRAGIYSPNAITGYLASRLLAMALPPLVGIGCAASGLANLRTAVILGCLSGMAAMVLPGLWLDRRAACRQQAINESMSDFLDLCVVCLDGGLSLQAGLRRVNSEIAAAHPILALEMELVLRDVDMGITLDRSLQGCADRCDCDSIRTFASFVRDAQRFGTPLSEAMRDFAESLQVSREHSAEERAQVAAVKMLLPTLLFLFPAVFVVVVGPAAIQIYEALHQ